MHEAIKKSDILSGDRVLIDIRRDIHGAARNCDGSLFSQLDPYGSKPSRYTKRLQNSNTTFHIANYGLGIRNESQNARRTEP